MIDGYVIGKRKHIFTCHECGAEIDDDFAEVYTFTEGSGSEWYCGECFEEMANDRWGELSRKEKADLLGEETAKAGDL